MGPDLGSLWMIIKLDHTGLSGWALRPMTSVLAGGKVQGKEVKAVWRQRRDWSDVATSQGAPGATRRRRRQGAGSPLGPQEGAHLDCGLLASRGVREHISAVFSCPICGVYYGIPQEITHSVSLSKTRLKKVSIAGSWCTRHPAPPAAPPQQPPGTLSRS